MKALWLGFSKLVSRLATVAIFYPMELTFSSTRDRMHGLLEGHAAVHVAVPPSDEGGILQSRYSIWHRELTAKF